MARCHTHKKRIFATKDEADTALEKIRTKPPEQWTEKVPVRSYRASCGFWHLTSNTKVAGKHRRR